MRSKAVFFDKIPKGILYDAILANPPYIDPARIGQVQRSVLDYEPHQALFSGNGGLEAIEIFLAQAGNF
jgi:Methylase of polypeptide chain release factors